MRERPRVGPREPPEQLRAALIGEAHSGEPEAGERGADLGERAQQDAPIIADLAGKVGEVWRVGCVWWESGRVVKGGEKARQRNSADTYLHTCTHIHTHLHTCTLAHTHTHTHHVPTQVQLLQALQPPQPSHQQLQAGGVQLAPLQLYRLDQGHAVAAAPRGLVAAAAVAVAAAPPGSSLEVNELLEHLLKWDAKKSEWKEN